MFSSMCCWKNPIATKYQPNEKEDKGVEEKCCKHCPMKTCPNDDNDITVWPQEKVVRCHLSLFYIIFFM